MNELIKWSSLKWSSLKWSSLKWSSLKWSSLKLSSLKWSSLQKSLSKLTPKKFYKFDPWAEFLTVSVFVYDLLTRVTNYSSLKLKNSSQKGFGLSSVSSPIVNVYSFFLCR